MSRILVVALILSLVAPDASVLARAQIAAPKKSSTSSTSGKTAPSKKKVVSRKKETVSGKKRKVRPRISQDRLRRFNRAFVASAQLKPMAQQLIDLRSPAAYAGVEAYAKKHAGTDAGALAWLAVGYARLQDKQYPQAVAALKKAQPHAGELADYVRYLLALAYGGQGMNEQIVATLRDFNTQLPESIFAREVVDIYGNALVATGHPEQAIKFLEAHRLPTRADVELALGRAYVKAGEQKKGIGILMHLYFTMPISPEADAAGSDLRAMQGALESATYDERKMRAALLAKANRWSDALREYRSLVPDTPGPEVPDLQVQVGVAMRRSGDLRGAKQLLDGLQVAGEHNAIRLYNLAEIARSNNDETAFLGYLGQLRQQAPTSAWFASALLTGANMYLLKNDYDKAIDNYRELATRFPTDSRASYAHWRAAWLDFRQGRVEQARDEFINQIRQWPNGLDIPAALYWRARIAEDQRDTATAQTWYAKLADRYRNYYYGYLARERLSKFGAFNVGSDPVLDRIPPVRPFDDEAKNTTVPSNDLRVEKSRLLENAGLTEFAVKELMADDGGTSANWATLQIARVYRDAGKYHRALQVLKRAVPSYYSVELDALPRQYWEHLFPRPYWTDLKANAFANGLDPDMVASLIRQESEFNPAAISHANAFGLMQLLPHVGRGEAREIKMRGFVTEALLSPNVNLKLGTRYFKEMTDHYNGQVEYALAAYNAGTNRVDAWLSNGKFRDVPEFVESIPFTETREYVQAIMRNAQVYRRLYPAQ
jgi:soluble lytic murein transglycosylase